MKESVVGKGGIESELNDLECGAGSELVENREFVDGQIGVLMIELKCLVLMWRIDDEG